MALAGVAVGEVPASWDLQLTTSAGLVDTITTGNADFWFNQDLYTLQSYLIEFTMTDVASLSKFLSTDRKDTTGSNRAGGIVLNSWATGAAGIHYRNTHVTSGGNNNIGTISAGDTLRLGFDATSEIAYLYNVNSKTLLSVTMTGVSGYSKEECYFTSGVSGTQQTVGSSAFYSNAGSTEAVFGKIYDMSTLAGNNVEFSKFVQTLTIPEPTTATLSLLALCGLAARRRRR